MSTFSKRNEVINKSFGRIAIIAVPLFFAASELIHPITQDTIIGEIESAKNSNVSWLISHVFQLIAIIFLPFLVQKLLCFIDERKLKATIFGMVLSHIGIIGVTGRLVYDFILWDAWKAGNHQIIGRYLEILNSSAFGVLFMLCGSILFFIGFFTLTILIIVSAKIKRWKAILILIGLLIYALAGPLVPVSNGHILVSVGALIMLTGFCGVLSEDLSSTTSTQRK